MKSGIIVKYQYDNLGNIYYSIKTDDNTTIKSISYSKFDMRLEKGASINYELEKGKARIIDNNLTPVYKTKISDIIELIIIGIIFIIIGFSNIEYKNVILISILIAFLLYKTIKIIIVYKKGSIEEALVIDKIQVNDYDSDSALLSGKYHYIMSIKLNNGKELKSTVQFSKETEKIKTGDTIKVRVLNDSFIIE